jgi:two-component system cell cycle sensor histidine kinase/response regulator CckA
VVKVDRGQLEQIIMNLSVNARDAMPNGGRLTIRTVNVELDIAFAADHPPITPGSYVLLSVSDTGNGMDAGTKARIFEPFFTKKERGKGTGLGLAAVYGIVKQSGGFIWLNSELGKGTTFDIYLPRLDERLQDSLKPCVAEPKLFGSERILLVEDEEQVLIPVREFLERSGYFVLSATNGADALRVVDSQSGDIDLLLTDLVMPGLDGVQVARSIRSKYPNVRVLYISGYADPQGKGLDKAAALLRKPFSQQLLASKIREVLTSPV